MNPADQRGGWREAGWFRRGVRGFCRCCCGVINVALACVAILLGTLLYIIVRDVEIPVPGLLRNAVDQQVREYGITFEWEHIGFDLDGSVRLRRVHVMDREGSDRIASAEAIILRFNPADLVLRRVRLTGLEIVNASTYLPAAFSEGRTDPVVDDASIRVERVASDWRISHGRGRLRNAVFVVDGTLSRKAIVDPDPARLLIDRYYDLCKRLSPYLVHLAGAENPKAHLSLRRRASGEQNAGIHVVSEAFQYDGWKVDELELRIADLSWKDGLEGRLSVSGRFLEKESLRLDGFWAVADMPSGIGEEGLDWGDIRAAVSGWRFDGIPGGMAAGKLSFVADSLSGSGMIQVGNEWVRVTGEADRGAETASVTLSGRIPWELAYARPELRGLRYGEPESWIGSDSPPSVIGSAYFMDGYQFSEALFEVRGEGVHFRGVDIASVRTKGRISRERVEIPVLNLSGSGYQVDLSFRQDFSTRDYRFLIRGNVRPEKANPLFEDWWDRIWEHLHFPEATLAGELDVRGRWEDHAHRELYGTLEGAAFRIHGLPVEHARGRLRGGPDFIEIFELDASLEAGSLRGETAWVFPDGRDGDTWNWIDLEGALHPSAVGRAVPQLAAIPRILDMAPDQVTDARAKGWILLSGEEDRVERNIELTVTKSAPASVWDIPFDSLRFDGVIGSQQAEFKGISAEFQGGRVHGSVRVDRLADSNPPIAVDLELDEASYSGVREVFGVRFGIDDAEESEAEEVAALPGKLSLAINIATEALGTAPFEGPGSFRLTEAELGSVHIFGLLSRILTALGLGFTSLRIDEARGDVEILADRIVFRDTEFAGSRVTLRVDGYLTRPDHELYFDVNVFFLPDDRGILQTLVGALLRPFGHVLPMRLRGNLEEPRWRFVFDPRNLMEAPEPPEPAGAGDWGAEDGEQGNGTR